MDRANSSKIKAVILDYGEVLCYPPTAEEWARMAGLFGVEPVPFRKLWDRNRLLYDRGDLSPEAYWSSGGRGCRHPVGARSNSRRSASGMSRCGRTTIPSWWQWLKQIHSSGIKTGLSFQHAARYDPRMCGRQFAWLEHFDHQTFSAEVQLIKPDAAIYEHSLRGVEVRASEALFVDDKEPNVQGARAVGMHAIQFQSVEQFRNDLGQLGFATLPASAASPAIGRS